MIVKLTEDPGFEEWASKDKTVKAVKMNESFLVETALGYLPGRKGDYLVEMAPRVRFPCSEEAFLAAYNRLEAESCDRRCGVGDRRKSGDVQE